MAETHPETVIELQERGILLVEDGNHGASRPRPADFVDKGVAFIRAADMDNGRVLFDSASKINDRALRRITKGIGAPGDVLLSHKGTVGKVALVPMNAPPFVCSPQTTFWRSLDTDVLDRKYLYALLRSPGFQRELVTRQGETDMAPYVSLTTQRTLTVPLPSIEEQRRVVGVLGPLDDKIELNYQMNKTLEAMTKAIFHHWFVDFEFPAGNKPYKSSGGEMVTSGELDKEIPKGWEVKPIDEIAEFLNGLALQNFPPESEDEFLPVIKIRELRHGVSESSDKASPKIPKEYVVDDGDVLFSWSASLEVMLWTSGTGALNQHLFKVKSANFPKWFYYHWILQHLQEYRHIAEGKATTMGHIQRHHLSSSLVLVPDESTLRKMDHIQGPIVEKMIEIGVESRTLSHIRDALLPKLMSGKIRVPVEVR